MTLAAFDSNGYLGDVATTKGWIDTLDAMEVVHVPALDLFGERGYTMAPKVVAKELAKLKTANTKSGKSAAEVIKGLIPMLLKARDILIISDGSAGSAPNEDDVARIKKSVRRARTRKR